MGGIFHSEIEVHKTEQKNGYFTRKILGNTCKGENKLKKIEAVLGEGALKDAIAYADE